MRGVQNGCSGGEREHIVHFLEVHPYLVRRLLTNPIKADAVLQPFKLGNIYRHRDARYPSFKPVVDFVVREALSHSEGYPRNQIRTATQKLLELSYQDDDDIPIDGAYLYPGKSVIQRMN